MDKGGEISLSYDPGVAHPLCLHPVEVADPAAAGGGRPGAILPPDPGATGHAHGRLHVRPGNPGRAPAVCHDACIVRTLPPGMLPGDYSLDPSLIETPPSRPGPGKAPDALHASDVPPSVTLVSVKRDVLIDCVKGSRSDWALVAKILLFL